MNRSELSGSETLIMKAIWEAGGLITVPDLMIALKEKYDKDYAKTTVITFLVRLSDKGYARHKREGKCAVVRALITEEEYRRQVAEKDNELWFKGRPVNFLSALHDSGKLGKEEIRQIEEYLNELRD